MDELFNNIDKVNINKVLQQLEFLSSTYKKNQIILSSVKSDDFIALILEGHVQIVKNDFNGNQVIIADLKKDEIFGSISANIYDEEYEIITKEDSQIVIIEIDNILAIVNKEEYYQVFLKNIISILYKKIREFNNRIEILTNKSIRDKLLAYFKIMNSNNTNIINLPFNFSNLADYLAVNRSAMSRELKALKDEGIIDVKGKRIKLLYLNNNPIY